MVCKRAVISTLLLAAAAGACDPADFEEFEEVTKLRVLAIRVDPPELGPGDIAQIDALVVDPEGRDIRYAWQLCALDQGPDASYACAVDEDGETLGFELSETATAELPYDLLTEFTGGVVALCESLEDIEVPAFVEIPACDRGFPMTLRLVATVGDGVGQNEEIAVKRVLLLREDLTEPSNANPTLGGVLVNGVSVAFGGVATVPFDEDPIPLQALVDAAQAESYDDDGTEEGEVVALSWFTTGGAFERSTSYFRADVALAELQTNELDLTEGTKAGPGDRLHLWLVLRDNRGGTDFADFWVDVVAP